MPPRIEDQYIYKRYPNGACRMDRTCWECGRKFTGDRNTCSVCRDKNRHRKFGDTYHRKYYRKKLCTSAMQNDKSQPIKQKTKDQLRRAAWLKQKNRIHSELLSITLAKLNPNENTVEEIEKAGVTLTHEIHLSPSLLKMDAITNL